MGTKRGDQGADEILSQAGKDCPAADEMRISDQHWQGEREGAQGEGFRGGRGGFGNS